MEQIDKNIRACGKILKTHGVKGEVTVLVEDAALFDTDYIIVPIDGLYVPFFIESRRGKSDNIDIIKIEDVDSESVAQKLTGATVFLKIEDMDADAGFASLEGYKVYNGNSLVGVISAIDDQTENVLFEVRGDKGVVLIPAVDEWVDDVNDADHVIRMSLPEGLLEVN